MCQPTLLEDRSPNVSSQNAWSHSGNYMMAYKSTHFMTLTHFSGTHLLKLMRIMPLKALKHGARICACIQIFFTVFALPEKNGTRKSK